MTSIQPQKLDDAFLYGIGLIAVSAMALFFVLVSWAIGGTNYKETIGGNVGILICVTGMAIGTLLAHTARRNRQS